jgi:hypothetical protein
MSLCRLCRLEIGLRYCTVLGKNGLDRRFERGLGIGSTKDSRKFGQIYQLGEVHSRNPKRTTDDEVQGYCLKG